MALTVLPSDGFITRLLQQAHHSTPSVPAGNSKPTSHQKPDQMSISNEARQVSENTGNQRLESKLMELYNKKGLGES